MDWPIREQGGSGTALRLYFQHCRNNKQTKAARLVPGSKLVPCHVVHEHGETWHSSSPSQIYIYILSSQVIGRTFGLNPILVSAARNREAIFIEVIDIQDHSVSSTIRNALAGSRRVFLRRASWPPIPDTIWQTYNPSCQSGGTSNP